MNPIRFAMRYPITMLMLAVALLSAGVLAMKRMRVDIFPEFNLPQIYIAINYNGMSPAQVEALLVNQIELNLQYVDGIKNVESQSIQQMALVKVSFYPGTNMAESLAAVVAQVNRAQAFMPAGVLPPQVMRMDAGSLPVGYLVLKSKDRSVSLGRLADLAQQRIRPLVQKLVPGTVGCAPFGSNIRTIVVTVDPDRLRSYNLTLQHVTDAIMRGNVVIPAGNLYVRESMPMMPTNAMAGDLSEIETIRLRKDRNVYVKDVATVTDSTDLDYGYALVNGERSVYIPIVKKNTASTLTVVDDIHKTMPQFQQVLNSEAHDKDGNPLVRIEYEFDESSTVVEAIRAVATEGIIGAGLTGLMVLIFLRDWRSVIVVILNIPLALLGSMFALWLTGNTANIMTLGGLALAIGILVDEATVAVECIHAQMEQVATIPRAVCLGNDITAVPRLLAMLCILSVFIPAFIMDEPVRSLFVPLSLAVGFSMIGSYVLSSTLVPVLATMLLKGPKVPRRATERPAAGHGITAHPTGHPPGAPAAGRGQGGDEEWMHKGFFGRIQKGFIGFVRFSVRWRWIVLPAYLAGCLLVIALVGMQLGRELFPVVDQGEFVLRFRMPPGTNYELTRQAWLKCLQVIEEEAGAGNVHISMGFAGQQAPDFAVNNMILFMSGPDDGQIRVRLREDSGIAVAALQEKLRKVLPERLKPWLADVLARQGRTEIEARDRAERMRFGFEPGDIVSQVMSFGSPTPIEVVISCPRWNDAAYAYVDRLMAELKTNEHLRDLQVRQTRDYPVVEVRINRQKANLDGGITAEDIGNSLVAATSSSRMLYRNYWIDSRLGASYQVQVQMAPSRMESAEQLEILPLAVFGIDSNLLVRDVADIRTGFQPGEVDRTAMQRFLSITANVEGEDLGRAARQIDEAIARVDAGTAEQKTGIARGEKPGRPVGVTVINRGQVQPMYELFRSLGIGLGWSVFVIFVMLTAYFQSPRLALASLGAVPGVLSGVVMILYLTNTTLNIEAFMGTIMSVGVSVSNSVMLVTFIGMVWEKGVSVPEAASRGAGERLRPILMTASAMTIGMVPMSLGLEAGSKMEAPLGLAVIGGLVMSTFATLLILPAFFTMVMGRSKFVQPSIDPEDPDSTYYDGGEEASRRRRQAQGGHAAMTAQHPGGGPAQGGTPNFPPAGGGERPQEPGADAPEPGGESS
jgi:multidrug efflux pump subunit AcrB